jgi:hypothetical protein
VVQLALRQLNLNTSTTSLSTTTSGGVRTSDVISTSTCEDGGLTKWCLCGGVLWIICRLAGGSMGTLHYQKIMTKSTKNQQICVDLGTAMTDFTEFVTSCKNQQFDVYFLLIRIVH